MLVKSAPLEAKLNFVEEFVFANEWTRVEFLLHCPMNSEGPVEFRNLACKDSSVVLDIDLLQRGITLFPNETYRVLLQVLVSEAKTLKLEDFYFQWKRGEQRPDISYFGPEVIQVLPSPSNEIHTEIKPIYTYVDGTKVELSLEHRGTTPFKSVQIRLEPESQVLACKTFFRGIFKPGTKEQFEAVITSDQIDVVIEAAAFGRKYTTRQSHTVLPPVGRTPEKIFQFLEPRRLSKDQITIEEREGTQKQILPIRSAYPLVGLHKYDVWIRCPKEVGVTKITPQQIPGRLYVRDFGFDEERQAWHFEVEVTYKNLFRRSDRLHYHVESQSSPLTGEIYLTLLPPEYVPWQAATAMGVALTVQGATSVVNRVMDPESSPFELFSDFQAGRDYPYFFLATIPGVWLVIKLVDMLLHRFRT